MLILVASLLLPVKILFTTVFTVLFLPPIMLSSTDVKLLEAPNVPLLLTVFNVLGQEVMTLVNNVQQAGTHEIQFQAGTLASGVYMYRLEAGNFTSTQKMILMK